MAELVVRVQWSGGFTDVSDGGSGARRTIAYNAGQDIKTRSAAVAIGWRVLTTMGPQDGIDVEVGDTPFWPELGDAVRTVGFTGTVASRVMARRVSFDSNGAVRLDPTLGSRQQLIDERMSLAINRLASGSTGGRSAGAAPSPRIASGLPNGSLRPVSGMSWSWGDPVVSNGPLRKADTSLIIVKTEILLSAAAPSDDITVALYRNGVHQTYLVIPQGDVSFSALGSILVVAGQTMQARITNIGTNTEASLRGNELSVQCTCAPGELRTHEKVR